MVANIRTKPQEKLVNSHRYHDGMSYAADRYGLMAGRYGLMRVRLEPVRRGDRPKKATHPRLTTMQYTKPMIDLVFQIRKTAPAHIKPLIKLADPDLLDRLAQEYPKLNEPELRHRIAQLMTLAGPAWLALIEGDDTLEVVTGKSRSQSGPNTNKSHGKTKVYRGRNVYN